MVSNRTAAVLGLVVLVALAGCAIGGTGSGSGGDGGRAPSVGASGAGGGSDAGGEQKRAEDTGGSSGVGGGAAAGLPGGRAIVRTGKVELAVDGYDPARRSVVETARAHGGYVASSDESVHRAGNRTWTTGHVTLRVPSENFSAVFGSVKGTGEVRSSTTDTTDVTDKLVDLRARLSNLRAQRDRLRTLYRRANETEDVLAVAEQLSAVQSEIERLEARQRTLERRVAYSTVTVRLAEPRPEPEESPETAFHETGLLAAFLASIDGVVVTLRSLAVAVAYALPYLLAFGVPVVGVGLYLRRR
ncbi:MAG: DUF4349 domain-containing protein [Haloarculaceae archaeon]